MMRLTDLDPRWASSGERHGQAVSFDCPCGCGERLIVPFSNPIDGGAPMRGQGVTWKRQGDTFETLTLSPSIDSPGHWHGWVKGGEVTNAARR
jgi:hypothetical protein